MSKHHRHFDAILFDMDGVIIDSKEEVEAFWFEKMELYGVDVDKEYLETKVHGRPARPIIDELFPELSAKERIILDRECTEYDASQGSFTIVPGVERLIEKLLHLNFTCGLVTSALPPKVDKMLSSLSVRSPFQTIVTANLVQKGKPDPECYLLGAEQLDVPIEKVLVFEDSVSGVKAASRAGATVVGVNEPHIGPMLTEAGAVDVIPDFTNTTLRKDQIILKENQPFGKLNL
jgi:beta-phosphoglucomutase-like phosphatase (HAD superfamily)